MEAMSISAGGEETPLNSQVRSTHTFAGRNDAAHRKSEIEDGPGIIYGR
jgi:hypothetical protein